MLLGEQPASFGSVVCRSDEEKFVMHVIADPCNVSNGSALGECIVQPMILPSTHHHPSIGLVQGHRVNAPRPPHGHQAASVNWFNAGPPGFITAGHTPVEQYNC
jgi:hypothetical protein